MSLAFSRYFTELEDIQAHYERNKVGALLSIHYYVATFVLCPILLYNSLIAVNVYIFCISIIYTEWKLKCISKESEIIV